MCLQNKDTRHVVKQQAPVRNKESFKQNDPEIVLNLIFSKYIGNHK